MDSTRFRARGRRLLTLVFLLLSAASVVEAEGPVRVYEVEARELSIDGSLDDWRRLSIPPSVTEQDLIFWPQPPGRKSDWLTKPPPGAPMALEVRLAWSAAPGRIFAAFDIVDDEFLEGCSWTSSDLIEIGVDGDNRDGQFTLHYTGWGGGCDDLDSVIERQRGNSAQSCTINALPSTTMYFRASTVSLSSRTTMSATIGRGGTSTPGSWKVRSPPPWGG